MAEPYRRASLACQADGITGGVDVSVKWFRKEGHRSVDEDANHRIEKAKHRGSLTILSVGQYVVQAA